MAIEGIHHATMLASSASATDGFLRSTLGLARVGRTVNADRPDTYHLFYGDASGSPGTLLTANPFPNLGRGEPGVGEIAELAFAVSPGALGDWASHLRRSGFTCEPVIRCFGYNRLIVEGPDGGRFALQVEPKDQRPSRPVPFDGRQGIRGLHSLTLRLRDGGTTADMLAMLGFEVEAEEGHVTRYATGRGPGRGFIDVAVLPDAPAATIGAGSIHHLAFSVADGEALDAVHAAVRDAGHETTEVAGRTWFDSFYFRGPDGLLFEVATAVPGFVTAGRTDVLTLPPSLEGQRAAIEVALEPLDG